MGGAENFFLKVMAVDTLPPLVWTHHLTLKLDLYNQETRKVDGQSAQIIQFSAQNISKFVKSSPHPGSRKIRERDGILVRDGIGKGTGFHLKIPQSRLKEYPMKNFVCSFLLLPLLLLIPLNCAKVNAFSWVH